MEINKQTIAGIIITVILLSSGTTYYIKETGSRTKCMSSWELIDSGEYEGYYGCTTNSGVRKQLCANVYDSGTGRINYWCDKGVLIDGPSGSGTDYSGPKRFVCDKTSCPAVS